MSLIDNYHIRDVKDWPKEYRATKGKYDFAGDGKTYSLLHSGILPKIVPTVLFDRDVYMLEVKCVTAEPGAIYVTYRYIFEEYFKILEEAGAELRWPKVRSTVSYFADFMLIYNDKKDRDYAYNMLAMLAKNCDLLKIDSNYVIDNGFLDDPFEKAKKVKENNHWGLETDLD
jgi:hypothetical protein